MFGRKRGIWRIRLQAEDGEVANVEFKCHWSPGFSGVAGMVAMAAAATQWYEGGKVKKWSALGAAECIEGPSMQIAA
jgi:hypothetical protein